MKSTILLLTLLSAIYSITPIGINGVTWGSSSQTVQNSAVPKVKNWKQVNQNEFLKGLPITAYTSNDSIAGYKAKTTYYFYNDSLFQATIRFNFDYLKNYDFNYNVFVSVDRYYREIRTTTITFVNNIYSLLEGKYGRKQPVFLPLDPKQVLTATDNYIGQERWNLRYNPSEYYKRIIGSAYARWKFPKTEINFAVTISAADKIFDYTLSYVSTSMARTIKKKVKEIKSQGL